MVFPLPVLYGTLLYAFTCLVALGGCRLGTITGALTRAEAGIGYVVVTICFVCMYMLWLMTWMHQWHPLIKPVYPV
jgi:ATP synthase subunit H